jgi:hypothetical protein
MGQVALSDRVGAQTCASVGSGWNERCTLPGVISFGPADDSVKDLAMGTMAGGFAGPDAVRRALAEDLDTPGTLDVEASAGRSVADGAALHGIQL